MQIANLQRRPHSLSYFVSDQTLHEVTASPLHRIVQQDFTTPVNVLAKYIILETVLTS